MMEVKKILMTGLIIYAASAILCACGGKKPRVQERVHIGVVRYNQNDTFISGLLTCFKEELNGYGNDSLMITAAVKDSNGSQRTQNDQVKELIDAGCNVLCVNLVERTNPSDIIDIARKNELPIIFFNREPVAEDLMQWEKLYYIGADARQSGIMQGELAADAIQADAMIDKNRDGKIQYVILEGEPGHQDAIIRTENVIETLKNSGIVLEKLCHRIANWSRAQAQNRMLQIISQYHNEIELVLANNDDMALGAIDAYEKANLTESAIPKIFGIDGTDEGLRAVLDSKMLGTVYNDKEGQARAMAKLAVALALGESIEDIQFDTEKGIYFPYSKVTIDNAEDFLKDNTMRMSME